MNYSNKLSNVILSKTGLFIIGVIVVILISIFIGLFYYYKYIDAKNRYKAYEYYDLKNKPKEVTIITIYRKNNIEKIINNEKYNFEDGFKNWVYDEKDSLLCYDEFVYDFSGTSRIISYSDNKKNHALVRIFDSNGIIKEENYYGLDYNNEIEINNNYLRKEIEINSNNELIQETWFRKSEKEYSETDYMSSRCVYIYNKDGDLSYIKSFNNNGEIIDINKIEVLKKDKYNNWIERKTINSALEKDTSYFVEIRSIKY